MDGARDWFCHPSAIVDEGASVGAGTRIWHFTHVAAGARIGRDCTLGQNVYVAGSVVLGDGVRVQNNVSIYDGVTIEAHAFVGPSAVFTNVVNPRSEVPRKDEYRPTRIGRGATVGANATVVCGHEIGRYAFVGAGAVVTADVPPFALVYGVPARRHGWVCRCGERLASGRPDVEAAVAASLAVEPAAAPSVGDLGDGDGGGEIVAACAACRRVYRVGSDACHAREDE